MVFIPIADLYVDDDLTFFCFGREVAGKLDQGQKKAVSGNSAFRMFQQMDSRAQQTNPEVELNTTHQNTITYVVFLFFV